REGLADQGLQFIRKRNEQGSLYFVTNLGSETGNLPADLTAREPYVMVTDPLTGYAYSTSANDLRLDLKPGKSLLLQTMNRTPDIPTKSAASAADTLVINSSWEVSFTGLGDDDLREVYKIDTLTPWTEWPDTLLQYFSGKATYETSFEVLSGRSASRCILQFDQIAETADVYLNGERLGTIWSFPNEIDVPPHIVQAQNYLKIVVQNVSANHMRQYDLENPGWKKFYDINFVDITYTPFDASKWKPVTSGLAGGVKLLSYP
ncbi:MAG: glycosylhydrolase-like jelly roll fold domain-containing protein, partial [Bacteroidota bacterium]